MFINFQTSKKQKPTPLSELLPFEANTPEYCLNKSIKVGTKHNPKSIEFLKLANFAINIFAAITIPAEDTNTSVKLGFVKVVKNKLRENIIAVFMLIFFSYSFNNSQNEKKATIAKGLVAIYVALCQGFPVKIPEYTLYLWGKWINDGS